MQHPTRFRIFPQSISRMATSSTSCDPKVDNVCGGDKHDPPQELLSSKNQLLWRLAVMTRRLETPITSHVLTDIDNLDYLLQRGFVERRYVHVLSKTSELRKVDEVNYHAALPQELLFSVVDITIQDSELLKTFYALWSNRQLEHHAFVSVTIIGLWRCPCFLDDNLIRRFYEPCTHSPPISTFVNGVLSAAKSSGYSCVPIFTSIKDSFHNSAVIIFEVKAEANCRRELDKKRPVEVPDPDIHIVNQKPLPTVASAKPVQQIQPPPKPPEWNTAYESIPEVTPNFDSDDSDEDHARPCMHPIKVGTKRTTSSFDANGVASVKIETIAQVGRLPPIPVSFPRKNAEFNKLWSETANKRRLWVLFEEESGTCKHRLATWTCVKCRSQPLRSVKFQPTQIQFQVKRE